MALFPLSGDLQALLRLEQSADSLHVDREAGHDLLRPHFGLAPVVGSAPAVMANDFVELAFDRGVFTPHLGSKV